MESVSHTLCRETLERLRRLAKQERRSRSNMLDVLLAEALDNRENGK